MSQTSANPLAPSVRSGAAHAQKLFVCIHGHFYQPPRESPWLEEIEREASAAPHHDWNTRITEECYAPNAAARILDVSGRVVRLFDNYARMSFNFGPTLLSWMERHATDTLAAIRAADRASVARLGQGNAIAQVYNHTIMPLCNERDKRTQIRWGLRDFERHFGRRARGMWLAETAIDDATVDALADEGVEFTVLSPFQARRFRVDGSDAAQWRDCAHGTIPTGRAYRVTSGSGKSVVAFFYDGGIAKGIAFERVLSDAGQLVAALEHAHRTRQALHADEPWLVHTATDGESYGHHFRFGDMALAAAFSRLEERADVEFVNYATFLDRAGVQGEAELLPVSAWSCAHGVGRWERDCGCRMNGDPQWSQRWRTPLRVALNQLRDDLADFFARAAEKLVHRPWVARAAYVDVVGAVDRAAAKATFLSEHALRALSPEEQRRLWQLLEMQRAALLMFTSCGWFFDDIAGGESVILMKYAARALDLAEACGINAGGDDVRARFLALLDHAESNERRATSGARMSGREIFHERAAAAALDHERIAVSVALGAATGEPHAERLAAFRMRDHVEVAVDDAAVPVVTGVVEVVDDRTDVARAFGFVVVDFGGVDWRGVFVDPADVASIRARLEADSSVSALGRVLDELAGIRGARTFTLKDAPADLRDRVAHKTLDRRLSMVDGVLAELLLAERALLRGVVALGGTLEPATRTLVAHALHRRAIDVVRELLASTGGSASTVRRLRTVLDDASELGVTLDLREPARVIEDALEDALARFAGDGGHADDAGAVRRLLEPFAVVAGTVRPLPRVLPWVQKVSDLAVSVDDVRAAAAAGLLGPLERVCCTALTVSRTT
jgi:alpha-amylase/alpha-mannosidase (GH57 family)